MDVDGRAVRPRARRREGGARRRSRTPTWTPPTCRRSSASSSAIVRATRAATSRGPQRAARPRHQGGLRLLVRQARHRLPQQPEDRPRPGHRGQRRDHGLRQHGRRLGHRRRLHPRPEHRREGALRRVPHQRPGRGRRGRHPDRAEDRPDADRHARGLRRVPAHRRSSSRSTTATSRTSSSRSSAAGSTCSRRARPSGPRRPPCKIAVDMVDEGLITKEEAVGRIEPAHVDQLLRDQFDPAGPAKATRDRQGPERLAGRGRRPGRVRRRRRRRVGRPRRAGRARPHRDLARRLPRHGRGPGHPDRPRRRDLARRGRRPPDRQAVRGRLRRARRRLRDQDRAQHGLRRHRSPRATGSASTARPARSSSARCRRSSARFEDQPELQRILGWADEIRRMQVWTNADKPEEAAQARALRRQGIGLCRTEHMFREGERLEIVRGAILVANVATRAKAKAAAGEALDADETAAVATLRRRDGQARGPPAGRLRGHLQGDGRAAGRHPPDRPAAPRVPPEPRGPAGQGDPGRGARRRVRGGQGAARDDQVDARAEPDARPARLPPRADDPGLREDPDPGHPQRADRGQEAPAAIRRPRS